MFFIPQRVLVCKYLVLLTKKVVLLRTKLLYFFYLIFLMISSSVSGQNVSLYRQFNGRYDFTFVGNTLNPLENSYQPVPTILTSSSATLSLNPGDVIENAYLYWAGSGTGDFNVKLNNVDIVPDRTFSIIQTSSGLPHFSAFSDVTSLVQSTGNGTYTLSDLDLTSLIAEYYNNRTNFGGWALIVVYKNNALPLNQLNIYDGLQAVPNEINILLDNLNVIDNQDAKIGFLAWEGDENIRVSENLFINSALIGNPPLNPANNAFNGTNSITNSSQLYNMDLDIYNVENNIRIGDTEATIRLTSGQDFVMINAIVTKFNSQLPDATVSIDDYTLDCNVREIPVTFTVYNLDSTNPLPANTNISIYAGDQLVGTNTTPAILGIGESVTLTQTITLPPGIPNTFTLQIIVDENGAVTELLETNNEDFQIINLMVSPSFNNIPEVEACNLGLEPVYFDFSAYEEAVTTTSFQTVTFYENLSDATLGINNIVNTTNYYSASLPKEIFVRIEDRNCFAITSFFLKLKNCPPIVYNAVSVNGDGMNDTFHIEGLRDVFVNFKLYVYNRWGKEVWQGDNSTPEWDGYIKDGIGSKQAPDGTYFYILYLNDPDYPDALNGYLYLNH